MASFDGLFEESAPIRAPEDLAEDRVFDDSELKEFLADLGRDERTDLG